MEIEEWKNSPSNSVKKSKKHGKINYLAKILENNAVTSIGSECYFPSEYKRNSVKSSKKFRKLKKINENDKTVKNNIMIANANEDSFSDKWKFIFFFVIVILFGSALSFNYLIYALVSIIVAIRFRD